MTHIELIKTTLTRDYAKMYREGEGILTRPFLVPGSVAYDSVLWDWDSWLSDIALSQILDYVDDPAERERALPYERGCILNFLDMTNFNGHMPICVVPGHTQADLHPENIYKENLHKPMLAQHAAFLIRREGGDAEWLRPKTAPLHAYLNLYRNHSRHESGLYYWQTDFAIGVDTDPCTFYRPNGSSASIYLNSLMYRELLAMEYICSRLSLDEYAAQYKKDAAELYAAVQEHLWDERDGFFYSADLNLRPVDNSEWLHVNGPRHWSTLIQRIGVWSGFMALWAGLATDEQAARAVREHYSNKATFNAEYGVRTLSRMEKMYSVRASGNPSNWLGPIWGISNYMTFRGLVRYGFDNEARELAGKTVLLFGRDLERFGVLHEYYQPDNGEPIINPGFQNWNYLVMNMIAWLEGRKPVEEF